jgi:integrase
LARLLEVAPPDRRLLYETAFVSGLRRNELAQLEPAHVDLENEALRLDSNWTKNRKPGLQSVPRSLLERLLAFSNAGFPDKIY